MTHQKFPIIFVFAFLAIIYTGCVDGFRTSPEGVETRPVPSNAASTVPNLKSPTIISSVIPNLTPVGTLNCQPVTTNNDLLGEGFLIVSDGRGAYYSVDMRTMSVEQFAENSMYIVFSPYSQALAYFSLEEDLLVIKSHQGTISLPWESTWFLIARWLDEENIQINEDNSSTSSQIILNPFNGDSTRVTPNFEDIYNLDSNINWDGQSLVSYSSNLRFAVYPRIDESGPSLVLVPVQANELRARLYPIDITSYPQWSPYGEFVVGEPLRIDNHGQIKGYELFLVGLDGNIQKITSFSETYDYPLVESYRWSPDYSKIVFWFTEDRHNSSRGYVGIVNVNDLGTQLICVMAKRTLLRFAPVWSTNQDFLAIVAEIDGSNKLIVIDMVTLEYRALGINFDAIPVGWVSFKP